MAIPLSALLEEEPEAKAAIPLTRLLAQSEEEPLDDLSRLAPTERIQMATAKVGPIPPQVSPVATPPGPQSQKVVMARPPASAEEILKAGTVDLPPTEEFEEEAKAAEPKAPLLPKRPQELVRGLRGGVRAGLPGLAVEAIRPGSLLEPTEGLPKEVAEAPERSEERRVGKERRSR